MNMSNVGFTGLALLSGTLGLLIPIALIVILVLLVVAIFRIRNATESAARQLEAIHQLLKSREIEKKD